MRLGALRKSTAAWLSLAAVLVVGTLGSAVGRPRPPDGATRRTIPSRRVVHGTARSAHRPATPRPLVGTRSGVTDRAEDRKAAALVMLLMLGRDRVAADRR